MAVLRVYLWYNFTKMNESGSIKSILEGSFKDGRTLRQIYDERLKSTGLKHYQVARLLSIDRKSLNPIVDGEVKQPDLIKVLKLGEFLNLNINDTLEAFYRNRSSNEIADLEKARKASFISSNFDLTRLKAAGFISDIQDLESIDRRICTFFGFNSVYEYSDLESNVLFSRTKNSSENKMIRFWLSSSIGYFKGINNPNNYDRDLLKEIIPKIRPYTRNVDKGLSVVIKALYNVGVTVLFQKHLVKTQIRGANFIVNEKPCIVITDLNQKYPTIWFALLHELHHVLYDFETIKNTKFHLTGESDLFLIEEKADQFAKDILFSEEKLEYIKPFINNPMMVESFAKENGVHSSIIYSFFQFEMSQNGLNYYGAFKKYFPSIDGMIQNLNLTIWDDESISDTVNQLKDSLTEKL